MTLPSTPRRTATFVGNNSATAFSITFHLDSDAEVALTLSDGAVETLLVLNSDYSITLNVDQVNNPGGTITYPIAGAPLAIGETLVGVSDLPYDQPTDLPDGGRYRPTSVESALDRIVKQILQLAEGVERSLKLPVSNAASGTLPANLGTSYLGFSNGVPTLFSVPPSLTAGVVESFTATEGQTVFTAVSLTYVMGNNSLMVIIDGLIAEKTSDYAETTTASVTMTRGLRAGTRVVLRT